MAKHVTKPSPEVLRSLVSELFNVAWFRIFYVVPHPPQDLTDSSLFQGFTPGILDTAGLFARAILLPADVRELYASRETVIPLRIAGELQPRITPLDVTFLADFCQLHDVIFCAVITNALTATTVDEALGAVPKRVFHISTEGGHTHVPIEHVSRATLRAYVEAVVQDMRLARVFPEVVATMDSIRDQPLDAPLKRLALDDRNHNVTAPNEHALQAAGYGLRRRRSIIGNKDANYVRAIMKSVDTINAIRASILRRSPLLERGIPYKAVITLPSVLTLHHARRDASHKGGLEQKDRSAINRIRRHFVCGEGFALRGEEQEVAPVLSNAFAQYLIALRARELRAFTTGISLLTAGCFAPALRLPPQLNRAWGHLFQIGACSRGSSPHRRFKLNKLVARLKRELLGSIPAEYQSRLEALCSSHGPLKIVSDLPLEWLPVRGLPLALRQECSRIPATPGNLFFGQCCMQQKMVITAEAFREILVIRSFNKGDRVGRVLESAVRGFGERVGPEYPGYRFVDVDTVDEMVDTLDKYDGGMVVFDCHGDWGARDGVGTIIIGGRQINVWSLRGKVRIPPIVVLSACDTHPLDGSHASVANGMLTLGAVTVLGTMLPISALGAALFLARLFYRIYAFVRVVVEDMDRPLAWIRVVSGMQRMVYVTEVLGAIGAPGGLAISEAQRQRIAIEANGWINSGEQAWFDKVVERIAEVAEVSRRTVRELIEARAQLCDCLKYIQLGNPERLWIANKSTVSLHDGSVAEMMGQSGPAQDGGELHE